MNSLASRIERSVAFFAGIPVGAMPSLLISKVIKAKTSEHSGSLCHCGAAVLLSAFNRNHEYMPHHLLLMIFYDFVRSYLLICRTLLLIIHNVG